MESMMTDDNKGETYITQQMFREYELNWIIEDFKFIYESLKVIESPRFPSTSTEDGKWYIEFNLANVDKDNVETVEILLRNTLKLNKYVKCDINITDSFGKEPHLYYSDLDNFSTSFYWSYSKEDFYKEWDKSTLSSIKVHCKVMVLDSLKDVIQNELTHYRESENLLNQIEICFDDLTLKDVTFKVENKVFTAHKMILSLRSPVFAAMFKSKMSEELTSIVEIKDIESTIFQKMLRFIYTDEVKYLKESAIQLYNAAEKYQLEKLKGMCINSLYKNLSLKTVIETLKFSEKFSIFDLEKCCLKYLVLNMETLKETFAFEELINMYPRYSMKIIEMQQTINCEKEDAKLSANTIFQFKDRY
ncbi:speckle-type POZ protein-like [Leptopilina boulardi]|uniref:speckle-type POZ protein-like n=1 Tax=Leptopilina boulardi TaxID=63433 RepID=UPI0021F66CC1|nr:speckle-type POZ protein-like [Leptopilina boulardi]XP_051173302.1 speckle-type POZ protein-like [Leptopilina boulardi]XP_051173303.1 speckle-type POZ protein-like [Leptopilina boulardi]